MCYLEDLLSFLASLEKPVALVDGVYFGAGTLPAYGVKLISLKLRDGISGHISSDNPLD